MGFGLETISKPNEKTGITVFYEKTKNSEGDVLVDDVCLINFIPLKELFFFLLPNKRLSIIGMKEGTKTAYAFLGELFCKGIAFESVCPCYGFLEVFDCGKGLGSKGVFEDGESLSLLVFGESVFDFGIPARGGWKKRDVVGREGILNRGGQTGEIRPKKGVAVGGKIG